MRGLRHRGLLSRPTETKSTLIGGDTSQWYLSAQAQDNVSLCGAAAFSFTTGSEFTNSWMDYLYTKPNVKTYAQASCHTAVVRFRWRRSPGTATASSAVSAVIGTWPNASGSGGLSYSNGHRKTLPAGAFFTPARLRGVFRYSFSVGEWFPETDPSRYLFLCFFVTQPNADLRLYDIQFYLKGELS